MNVKKDANESFEPTPIVETKIADAPGYLSWSNEVQMQIGARLAKSYDDLTREPPPDRFRILLDQLDRSARSRARRDRGV